MSTKSRLVLRWSLVLLMALVLVGGLVGRAQAVEIVRGNDIAAGTTVDDDVILTGDVINMDGTVNGTLIAAGRTVTVNGHVQGDALLFGETIVVSDKAVVDGNIFFGGATLNVNGKVSGTLFGGGMSLVLGEKATLGRNLFAGAYSVNLNKGSQVARDVYAGAYQVILNGSSRNVKIGAGAVEIRGSISGNAELYVGSKNDNVTAMQNWRFGQYEAPDAVQPGLRIYEGAKIGGKLVYTSELEQSSAFESTPAGGVVYQTPVPQVREKEQPQKPNFIFRSYNELWVWSVLREFVALLVLGALALWLAPRIVERGLEQLRGRSLAALGYGLLILIVMVIAVPVVALVLFFLGLALGIVTLFDLMGLIFGLGFAVYGVIVAGFFTLFIWAGKLLLSVLIGRFILGRLAPESRTGTFWVLAMGAVVMVFIAAIPIFGTLFNFVADIAGIGALYYVWKERKN